MLQWTRTTRTLDSNSILRDSNLEFTWTIKTWTLLSGLYYIASYRCKYYWKIPSHSNPATNRFLSVLHLFTHLSAVFLFRFLQLQLEVALQQRLLPNIRWEPSAGIFTFDKVKKRPTMPHYYQSKPAPMLKQAVGGRPPRYASVPCKLTISSYLFARWHLFRHVGYLRHKQQVDLWPFDLETGVRVMCDVDNLKGR